MRSSKAFLLLALAVVAAGVPAGAGVDTSTTARRTAWVWFGEFDPNTNTSRDGYFTIEAVEGTASSGTSVTPTTQHRATAFLSSCDYNNNTCSNTGFNLQAVSPTALTMDPIGNTATVDVCLLPSGGGNCVAFDFTMSRPQSLGYGGLCSPLPCGLNAWWDPADNTVHGRVTSQPGINRSGYTLAGIFGGQPWSLGPGGYLDAGSWVSLVADERVTLP